MNGFASIVMMKTQNCFVEVSMMTAEPKKTADFLGAGEPAPLKGKYKEYAKDLWLDITVNERMSGEASDIFYDVRSAVEWLKNKVLDHPPDDLGRFRVCKMIDMAFKDVTEVKK